jgi:hypothetical protein
MTDVEPAQSAVGAGLPPAYAATRAHLGLMFALFALAAAGWWWTIRRMHGMDNGPWTDLGTFGWFISVWIVMMAAMMFPSVAPTVALYARMSRKSRLAPVVFVAGYLITWTVAGIIAFLIGMVGSQIAPDLAWEHAGRFLTGATLLLAAAYELTPLKNVCLGKCRSPLGFLLGVVARQMVRRASHGNKEWRLVCRLLLGSNGVTVRLGSHEPSVDGNCRRAHRD